MARSEWDDSVRNGDTRGHERVSGHLDELVDDWIDLLGRGLAPRDGARDDDTRRRPGVAAPPDSAGLAGKEREERGLVDVGGTSLVITFDDPVGGTVVVLRAGGRFAHRGVSAPRGPAALAWDASELSDTRKSAIAFVADWFGAPFDAVNATQPSTDRLTWGIWNFSGQRLARCLGRWKTQASDSFTALLSSAGIDLESQPEESVAGGRSMLALSGDRSARGAHAERILAGDPRLIAILARAGRHPDAQLAQIDSVALDVLDPALASLEAAGANVSWPGERALTARELAALLYLDLRLGANATRQIPRAIMATRSQPSDERAFLNAMAERLASAGRIVDAHNMLRILSTPELERL
jgi:hypothetical protein